MSEQGDEGMASENARAVVNAGQLQDNEAKYQEYLESVTSEMKEKHILAGNL